MIGWVPHKTIDTAAIERFLSKSAVENQWTNYGPVVQHMEQRLREYLKVEPEKAVILCSNGANALHALVQAIESVEGRLRWVVPSFTFPCNVQGPLQRAKVADIAADDYTLDTLCFQTKNCEAAVVTNLFGNIGNIERHLKWQQRKTKRFLLFDNAATPLGEYKGRSIVNYGTGCIISLHHTKPLGFGEGGVAIIDRKYEQTLRRLINFGFGDQDLLKLGGNFKMSDISASYCLQYLSNIQSIREKHLSLYQTFSDKLQSSSLPFRLFPHHGDQLPFVSTLTVIASKKVEVPLTSDIVIRKYYAPLQSACVSNRLFENILCFPCHIDMTKADLEKIIEVLKKVDQAC